MKTMRFLLVAVASFLAATASMAQNGFNYQAVIRDADGNLLANQNIALRITLTSENADTTYYQEMQTKQTNAYGVVSIVVGEGTVLSGYFSQVPWNSGNVYMKTEFDPTGVGTDDLLVTVGTTRLQSVPVAEYAKKTSEVENPKNIKIQATNETGEEDALFEVKDKDGNVVFAVYNDGVRVYVDDTEPNSGKAAKSGFAVAGRSGKTGVGNTYFAVNDQGTQVYVDDDPTEPGKAAKAKFAVAGKSGKTDDNYLIINKAGTQIFVDDEDSKAAKAKFAVAGKSGKADGSIGDNYLVINDEGTKVFVDGESADKAAKAKFAVASVRNGKAETAEDFFLINKDGTKVFIDEETHNKAAKATFAVASVKKSNGKDGDDDKDGVNPNYLVIDSHNTRVYVEGGDNQNGFSVTEKGAAGDNGYMNVTAQNFFAGYNAGKNTTPAAATGSPQGKGNTFIGNQSGKINSTGSSNVFIGESAGFSNTTGNSNVNIGVCAGNNNLEGNMNVLIGDYAAKNSMKPEYSVVLGYKAGYGNMNYGYSNNVFIGKESGYKNQTGSNNVFIGKESGYNNTTGGNSVFTGYRAGYSTTTGTDNVFIGTNSGYGNTVSHYNIFIGFRAGAHYRYTGTDEDELRPGNTYIGSYAGCGGDFSENDAAGKYYSCMENSFFGKYSGFSTQTGSANTFIGSNSGRKVTTGICNTIVGWKSGWNLTTGSYNTYIGCGGMGGGADESFKLRIGGYYTADVVAGTGTGRTLIYGDIKEKYVEIWGDLKANTLKAEVSSGIALRTKSPATTACWAAYFDGDVKVTSYLYGSLYSGSDARLKKDVQTIDGALDKVLKLRGVSYYWKNKEELGADSTMFNFDNKRHIGVIAQELEIEFPELVKDDKEGIKTVEYSGLAPILIEAIKEQQQIITTLQSEKDAQQKEIEELKAQMKEILEKLK